MIENGTETKKAQTEVSRAADFVSKVIDSCQDTFHLKCAKLLVSFFKEKYFEKHGGKVAYDSLVTELVNKIPLLVDLD